MIHTDRYLGKRFATVNRRGHIAVNAAPIADRACTVVPPTINGTIRRYPTSVVSCHRYGMKREITGYCSWNHSVCVGSVAQLAIGVASPAQCLP